MKHILVVGNGLAGMTAAIRAAELGCNVTVVSKSEPARSQSVMAGGGINAALNTKGENDSVFEHAEDTIKAGVFLADEKAVEEMTANAPSIVEGLAKRG
ncbi:MAG TPA: FAD-dependent oxidoreductase, partial [Methanocorpusculum sp.]|nr:FAD-dependent oxidoreductase [Methanocorpusculum sp.]